MAPILIGNSVTNTENGEDLRAATQRTFDRMAETHDFNHTLKNVKVVEASAKGIVAQLTMNEEHLNGKNIVHGGVISTLIDTITCVAVGITIRDVPIVTTDISVSFMMPALKDDTLIIEASCLKIGRNMAFTEGVVRRKRDNVIIAKGRHTICVLNHLKQKMAL